MTDLLPSVVTFLGYLAILLTIAYLASRRTKNLSDYVLAGRHLSGPIAAMGAGASDMSAWLLLALPGVILVNGMNEIWLPIGLSIGAYFNWQFVAKRLRIYTEVAKDSLTIPAYLDNRFQDKSAVLRAVTALVILFFFTIYSSAGFVAIGLILKTMFGLSYAYGLIIGAVIILTYTFIGGFLAVSWIDFFQGSLMFFALIIVPIFAFHHLGGFSTGIDQAAIYQPHSLNAFHTVTWIGALSSLAWGLGYCGQPHIIVRFMAAKSPRVIPLARLICMFWMVVALYGAIFIGITGITFFHSHPLARPSTVFLQLAQNLFNPWISNVLFFAVISASMSTISAQLLVSSSALAEDFYHKFIRKEKAGRKELLIFSRGAVVAVTIIAICLALNPSSTILDLTQYAWSGLGAAIGPVILLSLYFKKMTRNAAIAGMITGALVVVLWEVLQHLFHGIFNLNEIIPGFLASTAVIILFTYFSKKVPTELAQDYETMQQKLKTNA